MPLIQDDLICRALAFWREGRWLELLHAGYAFLSFYKVIESQFEKGKAKGDWINAALPSLGGKAAERMRELTAAGKKDLGTHIFESGRCAVAHAAKGDKIVDPDAPDDRIRLAKDLVIIRDLAEKYIREVLGVPDEGEVNRVRDRLAPFYALLSQANGDALRRRETLPRHSTELHGMRLSVGVWPEAPRREFADLRLVVRAIRGGIVFAHSVNEARTVRLAFAFDFGAGRAHVAEGSSYAEKEDGGNLEDSIAVIELRKAVLNNHVVELTLSSGYRIDCDVVIPLNVDGPATLDAWNREIEMLRSSYAAGAK